MRTNCYIICRMWKAIPLVLLTLLVVPRADAARSACPALLVSGAGDHDGITVIFRNIGKLPIRRLEFNCTPLHAQGHRTQPGQCSEQNASFIPRTEFTRELSLPWRQAGAAPGVFEKRHVL
jgi:hypothetical protein